MPYATDKIRHLSSLRQFERTRNRPENDNPLEFVKTSASSTPPSQPRGIARLFRRAFHANASWVAAAPKSTSREPPTRFLSPLTRRALDRRTGGVSVAVKIGQQRESRLVATRAPRCSTRYLFRVASIAAERAVALKPLGVASRRPPATRAPTAPDGRIELARARRIVRRARPTRGMHLFQCRTRFR